VVRKGEADGGTVEVAHEALFREWKRLQGWLEPERARLEALRSLQVDAATWERNGRTGAFLNHRDKRLAETAALREIEGYRKRMLPGDFDYIAACQAAERSAIRRLRAVQMVMAVLILGVVGGMATSIWRDDLQRGWRYLTVTRPFLMTQVHPFVLTAAQEQALQPADTFRECAPKQQDKDYCPDMVIVPAGSFTMGSPSTEKDRGENEGPQHSVTILSPFAVSKYEVTFDEWDTCVAGGGCTWRPPDASWGRGQQPVIYVSWNDAQQYLAWLLNITGKPYRLLSEAEYEYATRAGTQTAYPWGDVVQPRFDDWMANCRGCGQLPDGPLSKWANRQTAPVGSFPPNKFGLHDMLGNVWEWVEDCFNPSYRYVPATDFVTGKWIAPADGSAWLKGYPTTADLAKTAHPGCNRRVLRGGDWTEAAAAVRSAARLWADQDKRDNTKGFRVARTLNAPPAATPQPGAGVPLSRERERALKAGRRFSECANCPEMVVVPAGRFTMGSPTSEAGQDNPDPANPDEGPLHEVTIAKPFAVSRMEVTFAEWDACVADGGCNGWAPSDWDWGRGRQPAINISWDDAKAYVGWLAKKTGRNYRLLTEAEYEYAARAGSQTAYPWGNDVGKNNANCYGCGSQWDGKQTAPVGSFAANAFGLYDMVGNVLEWTEDCYHDIYAGAPADGSAWLTGDCSLRVLRGGSWSDGPRFLRSAFRTRTLTSNRADHQITGMGMGRFGFRIARTLEP
jgi:formylglycine-generating enzyme required for sulfatase activity